MVGTDNPTLFVRPYFHTAASRFSRCSPSTTSFSSLVRLAMSTELDALDMRSRCYVHMTDPLETRLGSVALLGHSVLSFQC